MTGYLVVLRHEMDDLPVRLFSDRDVAVTFASSLDGMPSQELRKLYSTDASTPVSVAVVTFHGSEPADFETIKTFD